MVQRANYNFFRIAFVCLCSIFWQGSHGQISGGLPPLQSSRSSGQGLDGGVDRVKIGHVAPLSGSLSHLGLDNERGAKLAIDDLNKQGIVIRGRKIQFELMSEDDRADPNVGVEVAQKLVRANVVGVVGHLNSGTSIPAAKVYFDAGIPQISPSSTNPRFTSLGFKTSFRLVLHDGQLSAALADYSVRQIRLKTFAVIDDRSPYGQGIADQFARSVQKVGGQISARLSLSNVMQEAPLVLDRLSAVPPDAVFYGGMDTEAAPLLRAMRNRGIASKFIGGDGICVQDFVRVINHPIADGEIICAEAGGLSSQATQSVLNFTTRYRAVYGSEVQLYAPYTYDAVMIMVNAMKIANSTVPSQYLPILSATRRYRGVTGDITFDSKGDLQEGGINIYSYFKGQRKWFDVAWFNQ